MFMVIYYGVIYNYESLEIIQMSMSAGLVEPSMIHPHTKTFFRLNNEEHFSTPRF